MNTNMTIEQMQAELERLRVENEALRASKGPKGKQLRASKKGGITLPGIGVYGLSLYHTQWLKVFEFFGLEVPAQYTQFVEANRSILVLEKPANVESKLLAELKARVAAKKAAEAAAVKSA